jgi:nitroimidazol reductase NimA-like FMN-containing flavoprotein (pyridoxamine 5'-phosphate oxidase superfamily)
VNGSQNSTELAVGCRNTDCEFYFTTIGAITVEIRESWEMFIHDMTEAECRRALKQANVGRIACTRDNQPYVVPIYFAYDRDHLYAISTVGQKIEWMRANPLVCVEVDEVTSREEWMSVIVFGRYEELPHLPEYKYAREQALALLQRRSPWWWEPACVCGNHQDTPHSCTPVSYRIHINRISGHHATPDVVQAKETHVEESPVKGSWFANIFGGRRDVQSKGRNLQ